MVLYGVFRTGIEGDIAQIENLRSAPRFLPDNIYDAIDNFNKSEWTTELLGEDVKARYADLQKAAADRCPRSLPTCPITCRQRRKHSKLSDRQSWNSLKMA
jgi:glutamine synthetase